MLKVTHIVPKCPRCGSLRTGRIVVYRGCNPEREESFFLRRGEIVKLVFMEEPQNCFCMDCEVEWYGPIRQKIVSKKALQELKKEKGISGTDVLRDNSVNNTIPKKRYKAVSIAGKMTAMLARNAVNSVLSPLKDISGIIGEAGETPKGRSKQKKR